ncbi:MAG: ABC transporter permease [Gemmatimonadaceae bacterium]
MAALFDDVRFAARQLALHPVVALAALLSLAVGIGANASVFAVADALLVRLPPAGSPERLVHVYVDHHNAFRFDDYRYFKARNRTFSHLIGEDARLVGWSYGSDTGRAQVSLVSGDYFQALAIRPVLGRFFARSRDDTAEATAEVVVSWRFWRTRLASDPSIVGRSVRLNDRAFTIVAVAPRGFTSTVTLSAPDLFVPMGDTQILLGEGQGHDNPRRQHPLRLRASGGARLSSGAIYVTARLKPGVSRVQANADAADLMRQLVVADSATHAKLTARIDTARGVNAEIKVPVLVAVAVLQFGALLLWLLACSNVRQLFLAVNGAGAREWDAHERGEGRSSSLVRRQTTTTIVVVVASALGLWIASHAGDAVNGLLPSEASIETFIPASMNGRILLFTVVLGVLTMFVVFPPAFRIATSDVGGRSDTEPSPRSNPHFRRRSVLFVQVVTCTTLLTVAVLAGRSLQRKVDPGYPPAGIVDVSVHLTSSRVTPERRRAIWEAYLSALLSEPMVRRAAMISSVPLTGAGNESVAMVEAVPAGRRSGKHRVQFVSISPRHFSTLEIPILAGRDFSDSDTVGSPLVVIVNETFARTVYGGNALGRRITSAGLLHSPAEIVGVVKDIRYNSLGEAPHPFLYLPEWQGTHLRAVVQLAMASGATLASAQEAATRAARAKESSMAPPEAAWLADEQRKVLFPTMAAAVVLGGFGVLAWLLGTIGIAAATAVAVTQWPWGNTADVTLGSQASAIRRAVATETMRIVWMAEALGVALSFGLAFPFRHQLNGIGPADPTALVGVPLVMALVATTATYLAARGALSLRRRSLPTTE